jgi:hypothetical protein
VGKDRKKLDEAVNSKVSLLKKSLN